MQSQSRSTRWMARLRSPLLVATDDLLPLPARFAGGRPPRRHCRRRGRRQLRRRGRRRRRRPGGGLQAGRPGGGAAGRSGGRRRRGRRRGAAPRLVSLSVSRPAACALCRCFSLTAFERQAEPLTSLGFTYVHPDAFAVWRPNVWECRWRPHVRLACGWACARRSPLQVPPRARGVLQRGRESRGLQSQRGLPQVEARAWSRGGSASRRCCKPTQSVAAVSLRRSSRCFLATLITLFPSIITFHHLPIHSCTSTAQVPSVPPFTACASSPSPPHSQPHKYGFCFAMYSFMYDPGSKARILQMENQMSQVGWRGHDGTHTRRRRPARSCEA
jgi:hypothetical protein